MKLCLSSPGTQECVLAVRIKELSEALVNLGTASREALELCLTFDWLAGSLES